LLQPIGRLTREIAKIDAFFYHTNKADDRALYAAMLERDAAGIARIMQTYLSAGAFRVT
jgi:hypothetical protein